MSTASNVVAAQMNAARAAAARSSAPAQSWPGLSPAMSAAAKMLMERKLPDPNRFRVRPHTYFHRLDYPNGGTASPLNFFNVQPTQFICNLNGGSGLPNDTFFRLDNVRIAFEPGVTAAATFTANASSALLTAGATTNTVAAFVEALRVVVQGGLVNLKIGDFVAIDGVPSISRFPQGAPGVSGSVGSSTNSATTLKTDMALVSNGNGGLDAVYSFPYGYPVLPGKQIAGSLLWQAALTLGAFTVPIRYELNGQLLSPANL